MAPTTLVQQLSQAVWILVATGVAAAVVDLLFRRVLSRLTVRTTTDLDDQIIKVSRPPLFLTIFLIGLSLALGPLQLAPRSLTVFNQLIRSGIIFLLTFMGYRISSVVFVHLIKTAQQKKHIEAASQMLPFLEGLVKAVVLALAGFFLLTLWGVDITPLLASAGVAGVAVAFAAKDTLANLFGGISIFIDRPYRVGDFIIVDDQERGEVIEIGLRSTRLKTRDYIYITIPNSVMATSKVVNETGLEASLRLRIRVGVAFGADLNQAEKVFLEAAGSHPEVLKEPEPRVRLRQLGESSVDYELLCWIGEPVAKGRVTHELNKSIYQKFYQTGIAFASPQLEVRLQKSRQAREGLG